MDLHKRLTIVFSLPNVADGDGPSPRSLVSAMPAYRREVVSGLVVPVLFFLKADGTFGHHFDH